MAKRGQPFAANSITIFASLDPAYGPRVSREGGVGRWWVGGGRLEIPRTFDGF